LRAAVMEALEMKWTSLACALMLSGGLLACSDDSGTNPPPKDSGVDKKVVQDMSQDSDNQQDTGPKKDTGPQDDTGADGTTPDGSTPDQAPGPDVGPTTNELIITEIMANPKAINDNSGEWIEVYNPGTSAVDMNGWKLMDNGGDSHTISSSVVVQPQTYAVLTRDVAANNGGVTPDYTYGPGTDFQLGNSGDEVILVDATGNQVDVVIYNGSWVTAGASVQLADLNADNNVASNWCQAGTSWTSGSDKGTPGAANVCASTGDAGPDAMPGDAGPDAMPVDSMTPDIGVDSTTPVDMGPDAMAPDYTTDVTVPQDTSVPDVVPPLDGLVPDITTPLDMSIDNTVAPDFTADVTVRLDSGPDGPVRLDGLAPDVTVRLDGLAPDITVLDGLVDGTTPLDMGTDTAVGAACLIISEYLEDGNTKAIELYNCGSSSIDLSTVRVCSENSANDCTTGTKGATLSGTLAIGGVTVVCYNHASNALNQQNPSPCDHITSDLNHNGDDPIVVYVDTNANQTLDIGTDTVLDAFGEIPNKKPSSRIWEDTIYRRCLQTPYNGTGTWDVATYFKAVSMTDFSNFGVAPTLTTCQ
jgi:hypothetical protein